MARLARIPILELDQCFRGGHQLILGSGQLRCHAFGLAQGTVFAVAEGLAQPHPGELEQAQRAARVGLLVLRARAELGGSALVCSARRSSTVSDRAAWLLLVETAVLVLAGVALLSTALSEQATLLPRPVLWAIVVLVALALVASVVELVRCVTRGR